MSRSQALRSPYYMCAWPSSLTVSSPCSAENGELIPTVFIDRTKIPYQGHIKDEYDDDYERRILPEPVVFPQPNDELRQNV